MSTPTAMGRRTLLVSAAVGLVALVAPLSASAINVPTERAERDALSVKAEAIEVLLNDAAASNAFEITLDPLNLDTTDRSDPNAIGVHRAVPGVYAGDIAPRLDWADMKY